MTSPEKRGSAPEISCPAPIQDYPRVLMAHGGGGRLMHRLLDELVFPSLGERGPTSRHDAAVLDVGPMRVAFTTDSYVVRPLFFPGGNIGSLAVNGTINDLATAGARPLWLSLALIVEEGLPIDVLARVLESIRTAAVAAGVRVQTGDTKVVERGCADGLYINTAGIGVLTHRLSLGPESIRPGDAIVVSGDLGRHGMAIMSAREGLEFESEIESDCAPIADAVLQLIAEGVSLRCLRDLTRGGLASALVELSEDSGLSMEVEERTIPVRQDVQAACEILGLDPFYVACEGRFVAFVPAEDANRAVRALSDHPAGAGAACIGRVREPAGGRAGVALRSRIGVERVLDMPAGEQLPRIC